MKKFLIYFFGFVIVFFIAPAICTVTPRNTQETIATENNQEIESTVRESEQLQVKEDTNQQSDRASKTIKLLHSETGQIEELNLDEYLYGVVSSEMPASFEMEALKAQAVVARTYTIYQTTNNSCKHENADICDNYACCQA